MDQVLLPLKLRVHRHVLLRVLYVSDDELICMYQDNMIAVVCVGTSVLHQCSTNLLRQVFGVGLVHSHLMHFLWISFNRLVFIWFS